MNFRFQRNFSTVSLWRKLKMIWRHCNSQVSVLLTQWSRKKQITSEVTFHKCGGIGELPEQSASSRAAKIILINAIVLLVADLILIVVNLSFSSSPFHFACPALSYSRQPVSLVHCISRTEKMKMHSSNNSSQQVQKILKKRKTLYNMVYGRIPVLTSSQA